MFAPWRGTLCRSAADVIHQLSPLETVAIVSAYGDAANARVAGSCRFAAFGRAEGPLDLPLIRPHGEMSAGRSRSAARVRSGSPKANEMVLWTISSDERRELKRAAGGQRG